jgi:chemotaxis protein methyltransferase CheR
MGFNSESINLPENVFVLLRDLIHERTGLYYDDDRRELLADTIAPLVLERGFEAALDYYYLLKYDLDSEQEFLRLMNALSVQETYFWREIDQIKALVDHILPQYHKENPRAPIRIWSAACATGEEPLTIAMMLSEAGWFERAQIELVASDASKNAIKKACAGLYRERSFRNLAPALQEKYFTREENSWRVKTALLDRVQWQRANLVAPQEIAMLARASFIFCRNVFIYFSAEAIRKVLRLFSQQISPPGYLFVGSSESLLRLTNEFELQEIAGAFVYVKQPKAGK